LSLAPLGDPKSFQQTGEGERGGFINRHFVVAFAQKTIHIEIYETHEGKFEQYLVSSAQ